MIIKTVVVTVVAAAVVLITKTLVKKTSKIVDAGCLAINSATRMLQLQKLTCSQPLLIHIL